MMPSPLIVIIAALTKDRVIGKDGKLPWHIPEDLKRFKRLTEGHPVVMGRKTFESILEAIGKPLPKRHNIVLTRSERTAREIQDVYPDVSVVSSLDVVPTFLDNEKKIFILGGESVFYAALPMADRLELTLVHGEYEGDTFFPPHNSLIENGVFAETAREEHEGYDFVTYDRAPTRNSKEI